MLHPFKDINYSDDYISLYLGRDGEIFKFEYREKDKIFVNKSIKRVIDKNLYDLESVYGFSGYFTNTDNRTFIEKTIKKYKEYCYEKNIVAEFVRFHPFNNANKILKNYLDFFEFDRNVVYVDLRKDEKSIVKEFSKGRKSDINKAKKIGLEFKTLDYSYIGTFIKMYYDTMIRNKAKPFYFFEEEYFYKIASFECTKLYGVFLKKDILSISMFLESPPFLYYHLSASTLEGLKLKAVPFLLYKVIQKYIPLERFYYLLLGGGRTKSEEDTLYKFKKSFSKKTIPYYIGGIVFNKKEYKKLTDKYKSNKFLSWR